MNSSPYGYGGLTADTSVRAVRIIMSPTCSNSDLAGRNALLTADPTIVLLLGTSLCDAPAGTVEFGLTRSGAAETPWYVPAALGGYGTSVLRHRLRAALVAGLIAALALSVSACGGGSSSDANEAEGTYRVKVTEASFPTAQQLGQTYLMELGIRNTSRKTIPALTVNVSIKGKEGQDSTLPFGIRDPQPDLAQPDRPVWVLAAGYPKQKGSTEPGGAGTSNPKTFDFGPLKAGASVNLIWKVSAVKSGARTLVYSIDAGLSGGAKAETGGGVAPGGSFAVNITAARHNAEVTGNGEVVETK